MVPWLTFDKWDMIVLEGLLRDCERCPCESLTYLLVLSYLDEEGLMGKYYLLYEGIYFFFPYLLLLCRGGEVKIEVNKEIEVRLVISILVTYLPYNVATLKSDVCSMPWAWDKCQK